jgi:hypothetical protein
MCPLHGGSNTTALWVDLTQGNFACFSCGVKGGSPYTFEQLMLTVEQNRKPMHDEVQRALEVVVGTPFVHRIHDESIARANSNKGWNRRQARDFYRYTDEIGNELFTVWRFIDREGHKFTPADRPCPCQANHDVECALNCREGRIWSTKGVRRVLYRLPELISSSLVFVVEGEKNANDLSRVLAAYTKRKGGFPLTQRHTLDHVAVTTNPGGARAWKSTYGYGRYFAGKIVVKLGDNDQAGRLHDEEACSDIAPHALQTFTLSLPVKESQDISDYLATHTADDFLRLLPSRKQWPLDAKRKEVVINEDLAPKPLLVKPSELMTEEGGLLGDWLVPGLIERGTRGLVVAPPKTGKSLLFLELVMCLSTRQSFLGAPAYHRNIKCAVISREDGPSMVYRRLTQLADSRTTLPELDRHLLVNTPQQSSRFKIDREEDLQAMGIWLRSEAIEFCVIDVLNRLHDGEENNSDVMTRVMQQFDELAKVGGCQVCVIHHTNKNGGVKGSTSIEGWADYIVRLEQSQDDEAVKILHLRTKSSGTVAPRTIRYSQSENQKQSRITLVQKRIAS